jgi:pimeloyl-ACP methyl ester carboxylesterase
MSTTSASRAARTARLQAGVAVADGVTLPYLESGARHGVPVVFVHGLSDSARSFEPVLEHLPADMHALALTLRGHGDADRPRWGYGTGELATDVVAFLDALGLESAVVVGHSMGAHVAQCVAARFPDRVLGVVLIGAFAPLPGHPLVAELDALIGPLVDPVAEAFVREFQESTLARPVSAAFFAAVVEESLKVPGRVWQEAWAGMRDIDLGPELSAISAPVRLAWGDLDTIVDRAMQDTLLGAIPNATIQVYHGAGHAPHWEDPERFAADLVDFLHEHLAG